MKGIKFNALLLTLLAVSLAYAGTTLRDQDFPPDVTITGTMQANDFVGDGSALTGLPSAGITQRTTAQLQTDTCATHPATLCIRINSDDFDLYTSTGSGAGQFRNSRLGTGPGAN